MEVATVESTLTEMHSPKQRVVRTALTWLIHGLLKTCTRFEVENAENFPTAGPLLVVGNHFSFLDPVAVIGGSPWQLDFIGGSQMPFAPPSVRWLARVYGILPVHRGSVSRQTLLTSNAILKNNGILGIFPEGGNWASVLRPARAGAAYLAPPSQAQILPIGLDGLTEVFPMLRQGKRARVRMNVGKPFGPFYVSDRGETNRQRLEEIGHEIMRQISLLIPPERRGHYSTDPAIRAAAQGTEIYPWDDHPES